MPKPYMNKQEIKETFQKNDLHVTQAVKILLKQASLYAKRIKVFKESDEKLNADKIADCENSRAKYICEAIEVADMEKKQHWRLLEDKTHYLHELNDKYGDVDFINDLEDLKKLLLIYRLEDMAVNQQKNKALELVE